MLLQWSAPEYMPHSFQVSGVSGTVGHKQTHGNCFDLTKQVADGFVGMQELSKGLFLVQSEMAFKRGNGIVRRISRAQGLSAFLLYEWDLRMGLSPKARRALPAFPNTVQFAMWDVFTVRKPFRFRAALPYLEHFAGGRTFFLTDRRFRSSAFNSAG